MTFRTKIFFAILSTSILVAGSAFYLVYDYTTNRNQQLFLDRYTMQSQLIGDTLARLEESSNFVALNAIEVVKNIDQTVSPLPDTATLRKLAKELNVAHIYFTDHKGKFIRSTNRPPESFENTLFDYCSDYKQLITGKAEIFQTPIIVGSGYDRNIPYKYTIASNKNRTRAVEVSIAADFIFGTLSYAFEADKNITAITLFTPTGEKLGQVSRTPEERLDLNLRSSQPAAIWQNDKLILSTILYTAMENCCECKVKNIVTADGKYYYLLQTAVSTAPLIADAAALKRRLSVMFLFALVISLILANQLSHLLVQKLGIVQSGVRRIIQEGNLKARLHSKGTDEVALLAKDFDKMMDKLQTTRNALVESEKLKAIAQTTQMIAHDVRKPISTIKILTQLVHSGTDARTIKENFERLLPELERSTSAVEAMLTDILHVGSENNLLRKGESLTNIISTALNHVLLVHNDAAISFAYDLQHTHKVYVDRHKMTRVIANIIENAVHAMSDQGNIWFASKQTVESDQSFVELRIGNSGSYIPPKEQERIFEPFYTKGKHHGTGLGLLIAKSIVTAHGGHIRCSSFMKKGTEFCITLPCTEEPETEETLQLTSHYHNIRYNNTVAS